MTTTTYYNLNIVEGTDIVNPLTVDNPNYQKIDETMHDNAVAGVTLATEIANAAVHAITRENSDCSVIRFIATSRWKAGDTVTVDGVPVTALLPSGETLPDGAYVINANVLCILTGTNLTVYAERKKADTANEIAFKDTTVAAELVRLDTEINNVISGNVESEPNINTTYFQNIRKYCARNGNVVLIDLLLKCISVPTDSITFVDNIPKPLTYDFFMYEVDGYGNPIGNIINCGSNGADGMLLNLGAITKLKANSFYILSATYITE